MGNRFIILVWHGDNTKEFYEEYSEKEATLLVDSLKTNSSIEYIEVINTDEYGSTNYLWSNPNSNPEED